ncbi:MAG: hypothetical protein ACRD0D_13720 [Acidimicrobiales bacterium]
MIEPAALTASRQPRRCRARRRVAGNPRSRPATLCRARVRAEPSRSPWSRPGSGPIYDGLASDPSHPIEGGSANDYDYVEGDPINNFDLDGEFCITGKNKNGSCRGSGTVKKAAKKAGRAAKATGRWVNENRWKIAGFAVSGVCIAGSGGAGTAACIGAGVALVGAKEVSTFRSGGSAGDHAWNFGSTLLFMAGGSGWAASGLTGWAGVGARAMGESFGMVCSSVRRCSSPGLP